MNIIEALSDPRVVAGDMWARPTHWTGVALCVFNGGDLHEVPSSNGWVRWRDPDLAEVTSEWEIVTPEQVCNE